MWSTRDRLLDKFLKKKKEKMTRQSTKHLARLLNLPAKRVAPFPAEPLLRWQSFQPFLRSFTL